MPKITKEDVKLTLVSNQFGYNEYDIEGVPHVHRAKVSFSLEIDDVFNVYCFESTKLGCLWKGTVEDSLVALVESDEDYLAHLTLKAEA